MKSRTSIIRIRVILVTIDLRTVGHITKASSQCICAIIFKIYIPGNLQNLGESCAQHL